MNLTSRVTKGVYDLNRFHFKGGAAVMTEHGADCVQHYLGLGQVSGSDLNEDILGVQADLHHTNAVVCIRITCETGTT